MQVDGLELTHIVVSKHLEGLVFSIIASIRHNRSNLKTRPPPEERSSCAGANGVVMTRISGASRGSYKVEVRSCEELFLLSFCGPRQLRLARAIML